MASTHVVHPERFSAQMALEILENLSSEDECDVVTTFDEEDNSSTGCAVEMLEEASVEMLSDEEDEKSDDDDDDEEGDQSRNMDEGDANIYPAVVNGKDTALESGTSVTSVDELPDASTGDYNSEWCRNLDNFPRGLTFHGVPGLQCSPNLPPWNECRPVDLFKLFVDKELVKLMKVETNRYARQMIDSKRRSGEVFLPKSWANTWKPVSQQDIINFLAILIHMGVVRKPQIVDYWSQTPILHNAFPSKVMKRDRFRQILSFFHLNDNTAALAKGHPQHDPLHKVRPLLDHLNHLFKAVYIPEQNISIDEALCPWRGKGGFHVYMKDKPIRWGMKLYELCESSSGYVYNLEVMCNKPGVSNKPYDIVQRLMQPLKSLGYILYVDNYYCCPALAHSLAEDNTGVVGIIRSNREGLPKDFMTQTIPKGEADFRRFRNVVVMKWKDKREVSVITTVHRPRMATIKTQGEQQKRKPTAIIDYNKHMLGVDHSDQMNSYAPLHRKTLKWWKKLAFHLLTLTMTQAHCLYQKVRKQIGQPGMLLEQFIISVGQDLVQLPEEDGDMTGAAKPLTNDLLRLTERHFMERAPYRNCVVCYARARASGASSQHLKNKTKRTKFQCMQCKKSLCVNPCMQLYHTKKDYSCN